MTRSSRSGAASSTDRAGPTGPGHHRDDAHRLPGRGLPVDRVPVLSHQPQRLAHAPGSARQPAERDVGVQQQGHQVQRRDRQGDLDGRSTACRRPVRCRGSACSRTTCPRTCASTATGSSSTATPTTTASRPARPASAPRRAAASTPATPWDLAFAGFEEIGSGDYFGWIWSTTANRAALDITGAARARCRTPQKAVADAQQDPGLHGRFRGLRACACAFGDCPWDD